MPYRAASELAVELLLLGRKIRLAWCRRLLILQLERKAGSHLTARIAVRDDLALVVEVLRPELMVRT